MPMFLRRTALATAVAGLCLNVSVSHGSSHREAPFITEIPKVDATDFYMFRSYEGGRSDYVTLIANYQPLQDAYGGPNYFDLDDDAIYEIHIDNDGDAIEELTFRFDLTTITNNLTVTSGSEDVVVPLKNIGGIGPSAGDTGAVQSRQEYQVSVVQGDRRNGNVQTATNITTGTDTFRKPMDNIGDKSFGGTDEYAAYAQNHIYQIDLPACGTNGKVFVGQRQDAFAVNLGEIFDLVNTDPIADMPGERNDETNALANKNVTSFALEVPTDCLTGSATNSNGDPVIGAWTTASIRQAQVLNPAPESNGKGASIKGGAFTQVSRLGMPLVNEVVIGLTDKDRFNASEPMDDGQFLTYVTNPSLPELLEILFGGQGAQAPEPPRNDLVTAFLTGVDGVNKPTDVTASEMLRLNPTVATKAETNQNDLGVLGGDAAGFPNGRRPIDDVVDIALRVSMGALTSDAPNKDIPFTDGTQVDPDVLDEQFPYLTTPIAGSPNGTP
ncbi:hypothetical protein CF392_12590 [Tamilnaduibacter salinus]|uniref:DUF4331 domain-containing protein n=1 Tax=Tamilnaduibacter salinus TaxID=1484056 RepID=A0A2A2I140_9GAMM|nr:DUF4331 domain-containing protein [Tamilnaduibacter salinus]PAV25128.1 hypothetical protein CF392_12590 [Tamilnaduibacter salinus]